MVMLAPPTTPLDGSVTEPATAALPDSDCAKTKVLMNRRHTTRATDFMERHLLLRIFDRQHRRRVDAVNTGVMARPLLKCEFIVTNLFQDPVSQDFCPLFYAFRLAFASYR